jgi:hypothetical protein
MERAGGSCLILKIAESRAGAAVPAGFQPFHDVVSGKVDLIIQRRDHTNCCSGTTSTASQLVPVTTSSPELPLGRSLDSETSQIAYAYNSAGGAVQLPRTEGLLSARLLPFSALQG